MRKILVLSILIIGCTNPVVYKYGGEHIQISESYTIKNHKISFKFWRVPRYKVFNRHSGQTYYWYYGVVLVDGKFYSRSTFVGDTDLTDHEKFTWIDRRKTHFKKHKWAFKK